MLITTNINLQHAPDSSGNTNPNTYYTGQLRLDGTLRTYQSNVQPVSMHVIYLKSWLHGTMESQVPTHEVDMITSILEANLLYGARTAT